LAPRRVDGRLLGKAATTVGDGLRNLTWRVRVGARHDNLNSKQAGTPQKSALLGYRRTADERKRFTQALAVLLGDLLCGLVP
jgi:hypothetical protein